VGFLTKLVWQTAIAVVLLGVALATGCFSSPEQKYRVLSYFLDDVPLPHGMVAAEITVPLEAEIETLAAPRRQLYVKHEPYEERECQECHKSRFGNQLVVDLTEICWVCHEQDDYEGEVIHGPVAAGLCVGCHDPHKTPHEYMLLESGSNICVRCHDQSTFELSGRHGEDDAADCLRCHNPHASDREYLLRPEVEVDLVDRDVL
jgi:predicted CXXCH cytochrome family protein